MSSPLVAPLAVIAVTWIVVRTALAMPLLLWETTLAWTGL